MNTLLIPAPEDLLVRLTILFADPDVWRFTVAWNDAGQIIFTPEDRALRPLKQTFSPEGAQRMCWLLVDYWIELVMSLEVNTPQQFGMDPSGCHMFGDGRLLLRYPDPIQPAPQQWLRWKPKPDYDQALPC